MEGNCSSPVHRWRSISGFSSIEGSINALSIKVEHKKGLPGDGLENLPFWVHLFLLALFTSGLSGSVGKLCNELGFFFKTNLFLVLLYVPGNSLLSIEEMEIRIWILNVIRLIVITISSKFHLKTHKNHKTKNGFNVADLEHLLKYNDKYGSETFFLILFSTLRALLLWAQLKELRIFCISVIISYNCKVCSIFPQKKVNWLFKLILNSCGLQTTGNIFFGRNF